MINHERNYTIGLDPGQVSDLFVAVFVERVVAVTPVPANDPNARAQLVDFFTIGHLERWPLGTAFPDVARDLGAIIAAGHFQEAAIVFDGTGIGRAVGEILFDAHRRGELGNRRPWPVIVTGEREAQFSHGRGHVPKVDLVGLMQALMQTRRLRLAPGLALGDEFLKQLVAFRVKVTASGQESFAAERARDHDDLVQAVSLACYCRHTLSQPRRIPWPPDTPVPGKGLSNDR